MPELPEVDVVRMGLEPVVPGALIEAVTVLDERSLKRHRGPSEDFVMSLESHRLEAIVRRGKFLWAPLSGTSVALVCHLGMSGQVLLGDRRSDFGRHLRIRLDLLTRGKKMATLGFVDQRIFGSMALDELIETTDGHPGGLGSTNPLIPASVAHIARDPLDPAFDDLSFAKKLRAKNTVSVLCWTST